MSDTHAGNGNGSHGDADSATEAVLTQIRGVLHGLRFGSVTIVVQDGVVVQIDRTEKRRLQPSARRPGSPHVGMAVELPPQQKSVEQPPRRNRLAAIVSISREES
jgi:hypothetical protein